MLQGFLSGERLPHFWCVGCGSGIALHVILNGIDRLGWTYQDIITTAGIDYWGKADGYVKANVFHGIHGRTLVFSTEIKLANPRLHVFVLMEDGDNMAVGGNHLIHAARRNAGMTAIMVNSLNYGMTGRQYSNITPENTITRTPLHGHMERFFDVCDVVRAAGGSFVARGTVVGTVQLGCLIEQAMSHRGFSSVKIISPCPTHYGRPSKLGKVPAMMEWVKENIVSDVKTSLVNREELKGKFVTDTMENRGQEDYNTAYRHVIDELKGGEAWQENRIR